MSVIRLRAHAKINLALRVGARRDDGYHEVATVLQSISLSDTLYGASGDAAPVAADAAGPPATTAAGGLLRLTVEGQSLPVDNTVTKAVELLVEALDPGRSAALAPLGMRLVKRIPAGAGLGGGSSDAVAAVYGCIRLWELDEEGLNRRGDLQRICAAVGADVPFFLSGGTAMGRGRGDRIEAVAPLSPTWLVVAAPLTAVPTPEAYVLLDGRRTAARQRITPAPQIDYRPELDGSWIQNDLSGPVQERFPEVAQVGRALRDRGAGIVRMTGSGAASFGTFAHRRAASRAARALRAEGCWAVPTLTISADRHRRSLAREV